MPQTWRWAPETLGLCSATCVTCFSPTCPLVLEFCDFRKQSRNHIPVSTLPMQQAWPATCRGSGFDTEVVVRVGYVLLTHRCFPSLARDLFPSAVASTASSDSRSEAKERRHVSSWFFHLSLQVVCEHEPVFKQLLSLMGNFMCFELREDNYLGDKSSC